MLCLSIGDTPLSRVPKADSPLLRTHASCGLRLAGRVSWGLGLRLRAGVSRSASAPAGLPCLLRQVTRAMSIGTLCTAGCGAGRRLTRTWPFLCYVACEQPPMIALPVHRIVPQGRIYQCGKVAQSAAGSGWQVRVARSARSREGIPPDGSHDRASEYCSLPQLAWPGRPGATDSARSRSPISAPVSSPRADVAMRALKRRGRGAWLTCHLAWRNHDDRVSQPPRGHAGRQPPLQTCGRPECTERSNEGRTSPEGE